MMKSLKEFYNEKKEIFEIAAVLFVITGLMFNVPSVTGLLGKSLDQLKFFLVAMSGGMIIYLLFRSIMAIIPDSKGVSANLNPQGDHLSNLISQAKSLIGILVFATFLLFVCTLIVVNLLVYIALAFPSESIFLVIVSAYFLLATYLLPALTHGVVNALAHSARLRRHFSITVIFIWMYGVILIFIPLLLYWYFLWR